MSNGDLLFLICLLRVYHTERATNIFKFCIDILEFVSIIIINIIIHWQYISTQVQLVSNIKCLRVDDPPPPPPSTDLHWLTYQYWIGSFAFSFFLFDVSMLDVDQKKVKLNYSSVGLGWGWFFFTLCIHSVGIHLTAHLPIWFDCQLKWCACHGMAGEVNSSNRIDSSFSLV